MGISRDHPLSHEAGAPVEPQPLSTPTESPTPQPSASPESVEPSEGWGDNRFETETASAESSSDIDIDDQALNLEACTPELVEPECMPLEGDELCAVSTVFCEIPPPLPCDGVNCAPATPCLTCPVPPVPGPETIAGIDASDESLADYALDVSSSVAGTKPLAVPALTGTDSRDWEAPVPFPLGGEICWGQSQRPHESRHNPGYVAAVGRSYCPSPKQFLRVRSVLKLLHGGRLHDVDSASSTDQFPNRDGWFEVRVRLLYECPSWDATFAIVSDHWVTYNDGSTGWAETANHNKETIDCGLLLLQPAVGESTKSPI
jgi:hypothetical protein